MLLLATRESTSPVDPPSPNSRENNSHLQSGEASPGGESPSGIWARQSTLFSPLKHAPPRNAGEYIAGRPAFPELERKQFTPAKRGGIARRGIAVRHLGSSEHAFFAVKACSSSQRGRVHRRSTRLP